MFSDNPRLNWKTTFIRNCSLLAGDIVFMVIDDNSYLANLTVD